MAQAAPTLPIRCGEICNLRNMGVNPSNFKFNNVTLESDKFLCVRDETSNALVIVDLHNPSNVSKNAMTADNVIMNPVTKVLALRAQNNLQIYNLEMKIKIKGHQMPQAVVYWRWLDPKTIAIVTAESVYHWSVEGDSSPQKVFDRHPGEQIQVINYKTDKQQKWCLLTGITPKEENGVQRIAGAMQLYSVDKRVSQPPLDAHAGTFAHVQLEGRSQPSVLFCFAAKTPQASRLTMVELSPQERKEDGTQQAPFKSVADIQFQDPTDFPVAMHCSEQYHILFILTKSGYLIMYEIQSGQCIFNKQISRDPIFVIARHEQSDGVVGVDRQGRVVTIAVDKSNIVPYICNTMRNMELGIKMATRHNLPGAESLFMQQFERLVQANNVQAAAKLAAESPQGLLRTQKTIDIFKSMSAQPGQPQPILQYFSLLLQKGKLNKQEAIELARPVLQAGTPAGRKHIEEWLKNEKLECSEELGNLLKGYDINLALSVYLRAEAHEKVIYCFLEKQQYSHIIEYSRRMNYDPDYYLLLQQLLRANPTAAKDFALMLHQAQGGPLVDPTQVVNEFMKQNRIQESTSFLLDILQGDRKEDAHLQTRLLEMNLQQAPAVADAILQNDQFSHYDRHLIATLCEQAGLFQRALEHYTELADVRRVIVNTHAINPEFLVSYFGNMTPENAVECLQDLLQMDLQRNLGLVIEVAKKYSEQIGANRLIKLFEQHNSHQGLFYYLGAIVNFEQDPDVHFKYIQAAAKLGQFKEVERVARDSNCYNPEEVKDFLKEINLQDPRPLIHVCNRFGYVDEMTTHLFHNNMQPFIEVYCQKMNPAKTPIVIGTLLDLNAGDDFIRNILNNVRNMCPIGELVDEVEKRNRLKLLQPWLESRMHEGSQEPPLHNAIAKIYVDTNNNAQQFLENNRFYESAVVGEYCEHRDPHLAFVAYRRAWGSCDDQLIAVTNQHGFFKDQARYLVERQDTDLWAKVLTTDNQHRRQLIDQVVSTALPQSHNADEVSTTVKAFMTAHLPNELIELLEKIVLNSSEFSGNKNLQNLLILTAIKADVTRVMDYINRLDNYDGPDIAKIAIGEQFKLYEEAFVIYKKFGHNVEAVEVLIDYVQSIDRASDFAERCNEPAVWSKLAHAQLEGSMVPEAIASFIRANDATAFEDVIEAAERDDHYSDLVKFLQMARKKMRETRIDSELIYAFAKVNRLADLEEFISATNVANIQAVGDRCYNDQLYEAAKLLFAHINNNAKLAMCLVHLKQFQAAVDAARKANSINTWKEVNVACVKAREFRLAQMCGLHIIVYMDQLEELIRFYESFGYFDEVIALLEAGLVLERVHQGIFTQLGILFAKYQEDRLMDHIKLYWSRCNIPMLLAQCQKQLHWPEVVFLFIHYDQFDNAASVMMEHSVESWSHDKFKEVIVKVSNAEIYYKAVGFYLQEHPLLLNDLLRDLMTKVDHRRVVLQVRKAGHLPLIQKYLLNAQKENLPVVNEAVNELYVEEEDYQGLRDSIDTYDAFEQVSLAQKLEKHTLLEFRRIAAYLYKKNERWQQSVALSKKDRLFKDAMDTTAASNKTEIAEDLLRFFVDQGEKECFAACLYTCYHLIRPDTVLELAWRFNLMNFCMPFMVQTFREYETKLTEVHDKITAQEKEQEQAQQAATQQAQQPYGYPQLTGPPMLNSMPALMAPPGYGDPYNSYNPGAGYPPQY